jgi:hypothetical protein
MARCGILFIGCSIDIGIHRPPASEDIDIQMAWTIVCQ